MITIRIAKQCGQADFGWLQARYTFSFGHYFLTLNSSVTASLRVLNPGSTRPRAPHASTAYVSGKSRLLNSILRKARQNTSIARGNHVGKGWRSALISTQPGISYSEHNLSKDKTLTRMRLLAGCSALSGKIRWCKKSITGAKTADRFSGREQAACNCVSRCGLHHISNRER